MGQIRRVPIQVTLLLAFFGLGLALSSAEEAAPPSLETLRDARDRLRPLHTKLGRPLPGDWLESHEEPGQTFEEYIRIRPVTPNGTRSVIYLLPLGKFDEHQQAVLDLTGEYLSICYQRRVAFLDAVPLSDIPDKARREHPQWGMPQILSTYVLNDLLPPRLPKDGAALIALTSSDLWPGEGWNFVFGQASLRQRVGVWSIYRNGDPSLDDEEFQLCLRRTLKTASHELGHMFSMRHCTKYECNMCGSNNRQESDSRPLVNCSECMTKICWATGSDPVVRYEAIAKFLKKAKLKEDLRFVQDFQAVLGADSE